MSSKERVKQLYPGAKCFHKGSISERRYYVKVGEQILGRGANTTVAWWDALNKINTQTEKVMS